MKSMLPEGNAGLSSTYRGHSGRASSEFVHDDSYIYCETGYFRVFFNVRLYVMYTGTV